MPDICLQHMVAVMMLDKTASFAAAHDKARMQDPVVLKHRAKVELVPDEELQRLMPQRQAIVDLILNDGTRLTERVEAVRGTPPNPMDLCRGHQQVPRPDGARSGCGKGRSADSDGDGPRRNPRRQAASWATPALLMLLMLHQWRTGELCSASLPADRPPSRSLTSDLWHRHCSDQKGGLNNGRRTPLV